MKKRITLSVLITCLFSLFALAQQPQDCGTPSPPGADDCEDACVYCDLTANGYSGSTIGYSPDPPNFTCGTIENNQWFAFAAGTTTVEFTIVPSNCQNGDGVQGAIYTGCGGGAPPIVCEGGSNNGGTNPIVVTATNLVVGQIYWFMVDGYAGDQCDYDVTVTQGNTDPPALGPPGPIDGVTIGCTDQTVTFTVPPLAGASYYEWTLPDGSVVTTQDPFIDYTFGVGGQVCVEANNVCNFSTQVCIPVDVLAPDAGALSLPPPLCPGEIANISVAGANTNPLITQMLLITDAGGNIIDIINGTTGTFTHNACADFQVCTYNFVTAEVPAPVIGDNVNSIDCSTDCCDMTCQNLSFQDVVPPTFPSAPTDLSLSCFDLIPPMEDQQWNDNCDGVGMVPGTESGSADLCNGGTLTRVWEYTDICGNLGAFQQTINVDPLPMAAFINPPGNITVDCNNIPASGEVLTYTNNGLGACLLTGSVTPVEVGSADICGGTIIYTWEFTDQCGRLISHIQNVTVTPAQPASFINPPPNMTVDCNNIPTSGQDLAYTNGGFGMCLIDGTISPVQSGSADECGGVITYTWDFTDPCGNAINHVQAITVTPAPIPAFTNLPSNITVTCDNVPTSAPDLTYTNNSSGACLVTGSVPAVQSGNVDICGGEIRFTWDFVDPCGNSISHAQIVTVEPAPLPAFVNPPSDILVTCDNIPTSAPDLSYTNNGLGSCLIAGTVSPVQSGSGDICGGTITYTWDFTDPCGNNITHVQNITVDPAPDAAFINPPGDINTTCANVSGGAQDLQYTNNAFGTCLISGMVQPVQSGSYDACGGTISYTWNFTTQCGQTINHVQNINIAPAPQASFLGSLPQNITVSCAAVPNGAPALSYSNNESGLCAISGSVPAILTGSYDECGGTLLNRWTFTDACGRTIQHQQTITVEPAPIASFTDLPGPTTAACSDISPTTPSLSYDNNGVGSCSIAGSVQAIQSGSFDPCGGVITYTWTFTDNCNRTITHSQNVTVLPASDPVFVNPPADITINCGESFPPPVGLPYTNNETGNCAITGSVPPVVTIIDDLTQDYTWVFINPCNGATITHTQIITQNQTPDITVGPLFFDLCQGEPFDLSTLAVTDLNLTSPTITFHSGTPANPGNQIPSPIVSPTVTTTYYVLATNSNGCTDEEPFQIIVEVPPFAGNDGIGFICFADPFGINLFDYLTGNPQQTGLWQSLDGVDVSNPFSVNLYNYPPGSYTFNYEVASFGVCPNASSSVTLELLPEILVEVMDIACSDDPDFYEVLVNTNGFNIFYNAGTLTDLGSNQVSISDIPIGVTLVINASNPTQLQCLLDIVVSPPDCDCDIIDPPVNDGDLTICFGEPTPELSVTVGPGETANWYDAPNGGTLLLAGSLTYTPAVTAPGLYQYYVETENIADGCLSLIRTLVQLEIIENPVGVDAQLEACDDDDDGYVLFDLTEANALLSTNPTYTYTFYETLMDAENGTSPLSTDYTNTSTPTQDLYVVINSPEGCSSIVTLTLLVNPLPVIDLDVTNEACLGDGNGSVVINSATGVNYSLDGTNWTTENTFDGLATGSYTAYVEAATLCVSSLDFTIEPGMELMVTAFESTCDNNGTATDPDDDFYTITFTIGNSLGITGTYTASDGTTDLGTFNYDESNSLTIPAEGQSLIFTFTDDILACAIDQTAGPLEPCSSDCLISLDQLDFACDDNGTSADPSDDFYTITINASAINGSANNTYNVLIDGVVSYNFPYDVVSNFTLPSNGTSPTITVVDNQFAGCEAEQNIGPLVTCSDDCILNGIASMIVCNDEGTGSDPLDDTYTLELLVTGQNLSAGWQTDDGLYSGDYDISQVLGPLLISDGTLTLTILDNVNQSCAIEVTVTPPATCSSCGQTVDAGPGATLTCDDEEATLTGMASEPGDYTWTGPGTFLESTLSVTVSDPGWYFFNVDFVGSCSTMDSVLVEMDNDLPTADAGVDETLGCTDIEVELQGSGSSPNGLPNYEWFNASSTSLGIGQTLTVMDAGVYTLMVTNSANGCAIFDEVEVFENNEAPEAIVLEPELLNCEIDEVLLDGSTSTGIGTLSYEWQNSVGDIIGIEATTTVNEAGNYLLVISDSDNDCTNSIPVEVLENMDTPTAMAVVDAELSCDNLTVTIDGSSSTGNGTLAFEWFDEDNILLGETDQVNTAETGIITLVVTNIESNCTDEFAIEVLGDTVLPEADAGPSTTLTCDVTTALLDAGLSTGNSNLTYEWTDSNDDVIAETDTTTVNQPGIYTVLVTAENGCADEATVEILASADVPFADAGPDGVLGCDIIEIELGTAATTTGTSITYQWLDGNNVVIGEDLYLMVTDSGTYTLEVLNTTNNCVTSDVVQITENNIIPIADAGPDGVLDCDVEEIMIGTSNTSIGATITYQWLDEDNMVVGMDPFLSIDQDGIYTLEVNNSANNCASSDVVEITESAALPTVDPGLDGVLTCDSTSVMIGGSGTSEGTGITYEWQNSNGEVVGMTPTMVVSEVDTFTLFVFNSTNGCDNNASVVVVGDALAPIADAGPSTTLDCQVMTATLDASASTGSNSLTYQWTDPNGDVIDSTGITVVSQPGIYTVQVGTANGCIDEATVEIFASADVPLADAGPDGTLDCNIDQIMIGTSNTSTGSTITYQWLDTNNIVVGIDPFLNIEAAGIYTLEVSNSANNCISSDVVEISQSAALPTVDPGLDGVLTCDSTSVMIGGLGTSTGTGISYEWQNSNGEVVGMTPTIVVSEVDTFTLFVFNSTNGCDNNASVVVVGDALAPIADAGPSTTLDCQVMTATLDASASTGSNSLTYQWTDPNGDVIDSTGITVVSQPGIYTVQVGTANGCTDEATVEIFASAAIPLADAGPDAVLDCNVDQVEIGTSNTSTGSTITYQWLDEDNMVVGVDPFLMVTENGIYTLEVSNSSNNCMSSDVVEITDDYTNPMVDPGNGGTLTCDLTSILLGGSGSSTGTTITYEWRNSNGDVIGMTPTIMVADPDIYTLFVFNGENGCSENAMVEVFENTAIPIADAGVDQELNCTDPSIILDGGDSSGNNLSFEWLNPSMDSIGDSPMIEVAANGVYTLIVMNTENGCLDESTVEVTSDNNIPESIPIVQNLLTCADMSTVLDGSLSTGANGELLYQWLDDQSAEIATTVSTTVTTPGMYTLVVTDTINGCVHAVDVEVEQNITTPVADAGVDQILTCDVTQVTLFGTASNGSNFSYEWFDDNMTTIGMSQNVTVSSTGIYQLQVTNADNGCTAISTAEVIPDANIPVAEAGLGGVLTCDVLSVVLDGTGSETGSDIQYEWQDANGQALGDALTLTVTEPGFYTLVVMDTDNNCVTEDNVFVDQNTEDPIAAIDPIGMLDCNEQSLVLNGTGSFPAGNISFEWSTGNGNISSGTTSPNPEIDAPGTYTLTIVDVQNGCENSTAITVEQNIEPPEILINTPELLNCLITQTVINASNSSTNGDFVYQWISNPVGGIFSGAQTLTPMVDAPGIYTLTILNNENGCTSTESVSVDEDITAPIASASVDDELDCVTTSIQLDGTGSSSGSNYIYLWDGPGIISGATGLDPTINTGGFYSILVTDTQNGCTETAELLVSENGNVPTGVNVLIDPPLCYGDRGSIEILNVQGGAAPYVYSFDGGASFYPFDVFNNLEPGSYDILVQDAIGCEYEESFFIPGVPELLIDLGADILIELGESAQLNLVINIPTAQIDTIIWSPIENLSCSDCLNPTATPINETKYEVTLVDINGCTAEDEIILRVAKDRGVFIPNVFSPHNQDGVNDGFMIFANLDQVVSVNSFQVFDRWGELVFEDYDFQPNDPAHSWDGYLRGEPMNPAVFVYWAEITFVDGVKKLYKGDVTIVR